MTHLGPLLSRSLVRNIGGHAARSELDKLCEPLKKLVTTRPEAQGWLHQALMDGEDSSNQEGGLGVGMGGFPGAERVGVEERVGFLRRVVG
jgi:hypothetical protein